VEAMIRALFLCSLLIPSQLHAQPVNDCRNIIITYSFTSRAQFQCKFHDYSREMIEAAATCSRKMPKQTVNDLLHIGTDTFDQHAFDEGQAHLCERVLHDFPMVLRR
jgi:hypothetical protein